MFNLESSLPGVYTPQRSGGFRAAAAVAAAAAAARAAARSCSQLRVKKQLKQPLPAAEAAAAAADGAAVPPPRAAAQTRANPLLQRPAAKLRLRPFCNFWKRSFFVIALELRGGEPAAGGSGAQPRDASPPRRAAVRTVGGGAGGPAGGRAECGVAAELSIHPRRPYGVSTGWSSSRTICPSLSFAHFAETPGGLRAQRRGVQTPRAHLPSAPQPQNRLSRQTGAHA